MKVVDLSLEIADKMPRYPSPYLPDVEVKPAATHAIEGRSAHVLKFGTHVSTHIDAPYHAVADGLTVDQISLEQLIGKAEVIHTACRPLGASDFKDVPKSVEKLIIHTGWAEKNWGTRDYFTEGPFLTHDAAEFLTQLPNLHLLGMDFPNVDSNVVMGQPNPIHQILLTKNILLLENLLNLNQLDKQVTLIALPLKLVGGDGCPCRAVAIIDGI